VGVGEVGGAVVIPAWLLWLESCDFVAVCMSRVRGVVITYHSSLTLQPTVSPLVSIHPYPNFAANV